MGALQGNQARAMASWCIATLLGTWTALTTKSQWHFA